MSLVSPKKVVVHPVVLLSVVDHFNRMGKIGNVGRCVGALLGSVTGSGIVDITNSFGVPFEEDQKDADVWFLDIDYLKSMYAMCKKVNARDQIVGWYHTGPKLRKNDVRVNEMMKTVSAGAILVIVDVQPKELGLPVDAYIGVEEVHDDGSPTTKTFEHLPSEIGAEEAEEVGVEQLLRDIKNTTFGSLSQKIGAQLRGLRGLESHLRDMVNYLNDVVEGRMPINQPIAYLLQDMFNVVPDVHVESLVRSLYINTNDQTLVVYVASLIRSIIALHNLIDNKIVNRDAEKEQNNAAGKEKEKDKDAKGGASGDTADATDKAGGDKTNPSDDKKTDKGKEGDSGDKNIGKTNGPTKKKTNIPSFSGTSSFGSCGSETETLSFNKVFGRALQLGDYK